MILQKTNDARTLASLSLKVIDKERFVYYGGKYSGREIYS